MTEDDEYMFLDSCASNKLFILRNQSYLESFTYSGEVTQTTVPMHSCLDADLADTRSLW